MSAKKQDPIDGLRRALDERKAGKFVPIVAPHVELSGAHLPASDLVEANLRGAELAGAILAGARLARADLRGANLIGASLDGADLTDADLRGADLAGARVDDAVFTNARLEGACLTSILGDPLSMVDARMDRATLRLSEFTMRDIAEMVVRGALVDESNSIPPSEPASKAEVRKSALRQEEEAMAPREAPVPPGVSALAGAPSTALAEFPPSRFGATRTSSYFPPSAQASIVPVIREAEVVARQAIADQDAGEVPVSRRMFQDLNALIDAARVEQTSEALSLRPQLPTIERMKAQAFQFPSVGEEYLGVKIVEALRPGTSARCFRAEGEGGARCIVKIFDPGCHGAALQLPAFQRGLRALNKLQGLRTDAIRVVELLVVGADQTAYVMKEYTQGTLTDLVEGSLSLQEGLAAVQSLCQSVDEIHQQGLMVRAWKPSNLFVDSGGLILGELDMVHLSTLSQYRADLSGYRNYAAPEEIVGGGTRSPTADVFSLGKILEYVLTREEPFVPLGGRRLLEESENIPGVLVSIVKRATAHEPKDRYQEPFELVHDLSVFQSEGDSAVLAASIRPQKVSQLSVAPLSNNPKLPAVRTVIAEHTKRAKRPKSANVLSARRQMEVGAAILGGVGGLAIVALLVLSPSSVNQLETALPYLSGLMGLSVFGFRAPQEKVVLFRLVTWVAAAGAIWLVDPLQLAQVTWQHRLSNGSLQHRALAAQNLSRLGKGDLSGAELTRANLSGKDLASVNFSRAKLQDANFRSAFLIEARFTQADVTGAHFEGANLFGADFEAAIGVNEAMCNEFTVLPATLGCKRGTFVYRDEDVNRGDE